MIDQVQQIPNSQVIRPNGHQSIVFEPNQSIQFDDAQKYSMQSISLPKPPIGMTDNSSSYRR